ncbi:MAG: 6-phosphofructokinase [Candidatus Aminicenantes bacterium RBG_13_62_12]|jgi:6-phosphofructokinase 1|nr:MAG: 6-phosphofructokinase [Candidatus Aminicenantes bacterium RBG_13_62_12]
MKKNNRIAILTGGGDCPGINAVIRSVAKKAILEYGMEIIGVADGYEGLIHDRHRRLHYDDVSGILTVGGTILGASKISNPYRYAVKGGGRLAFKDVSRKAVLNTRKWGIDALVCIGGDGTLGIAHRLMRDGVPVVGVPKTIDNDLRGTDITFGFDSAVAIATEAIDRIHTTAQSHHRIMIVEVMGHRAGWIALHSGVAGGGDIILIPEIPYDVDAVAAKVKERNRKGRRFSIVVIAEGAKPRGGDIVVRRLVEKSADPVRLGGVGFVLQEALERATGMEARTVVLGHLQRGGSPTAADRVLATQLGTETVDLIVRGELGRMAAVRDGAITSVPLEVAAGGPRTVPLDHPLIAAARSIGTSFGV